MAVTVSASSPFSAAALRLLADEIERQGVTDTAYIPVEMVSSVTGTSGSRWQRMVER